MLPTTPNAALNFLAVLGGNDPHSYGVTSRRASMNTLRPKFGRTSEVRTRDQRINLPL